MHANGRRHFEMEVTQPHRRLVQMIITRMKMKARNTRARRTTLIPTPGHTPGSVSFLVKTGERQVLFAGDTLFRRSIGRTDLWGGDGEAILVSIRKKLFSLDEATSVVTGHGPTTTIGEEKRFNPFRG